MPTPFQTPRRNPWFNPLETLEKTPGPGVIDNTTVVTKYVSQTVSSIGVPRPLRASKGPFYSHRHSRAGSTMPHGR